MPASNATKLCTVLLGQLLRNRYFVGFYGDKSALAVRPVGKRRSRDLDRTEDVLLDNFVIAVDAERTKAIVKLGVVERDFLTKVLFKLDVIGPRVATTKQVTCDWRKSDDKVLAELDYECPQCLLSGPKGAADAIGGRLQQAPAATSAPS